MAVIVRITLRPKPPGEPGGSSKLPAVCMLPKQSAQLRRRCMRVDWWHMPKVAAGFMAQQVKEA